MLDTDFRSTLMQQNESHLISCLSSIEMVLTNTLRLAVKHFCPRWWKHQYSCCCCVCFGLRWLYSMHGILATMQPLWVVWTPKVHCWIWEMQIHQSASIQARNSTDGPIRLLLINGRKVFRNKEEEHWVLCREDNTIKSKWQSINTIKWARQTQAREIQVQPTKMRINLSINHYYHPQNFTSWHFPFH